LPAEADSPIVGGRVPYHIVRTWKAVAGMRPSSSSDVTHHSKSIEQFEPYDQRQLLTGEGVHQCLEDCQELRWLHSPEPISERFEKRVVFGGSIPVAEVDACTQQSIDSGTDSLALRPTP
jgi:hypothetical protein